MCSIFISIAIHFLDSFLVLSQVQLKTFSFELNDEKIPTETLANVRSIRHHVKAFGFFNNCETQLVNGWEKTTIKNKILHHENQSLRKALRAEQKHQKKMGLLAGDELKQAMFFLLGRIVIMKKQAVALEIQRKQKKFNKTREKQAKITKQERKI